MNLKPITLVIAAISLAGCASTSGGDPEAASSSAALTSSPAASASSCASQANAWRAAGGQTAVDNLTGSLAAVRSAALSMTEAADGNEDMSASEAALQSAAATLQSGTQGAQGDLPPSCIPEFRADLSTSLAAYGTAAQDWQNTVNEINSGSDEVALGDLAAGLKAAGTGNAKLDAADSDLSSWEKAGEP
jgi:hypothetical protein